ncbi:MAG: DUF5076 domain-containing protein [Phycisphaerales bacterium]
MPHDDRELEMPWPIVNDPKAVEIARIWATPGGPQSFSLRPDASGDPAAWGLLLVDVARHVANALSEDDTGRAAVLARIRSGFDAEWEGPTTEIKEERR